jgi:hypothetical protein
MTIVLDIITQAYRESNLLPLGDVPSADQAAEGLTLLNRVVSSALGYDIGDKLVDWNIGPDQNDPSWAESQWTYPTVDTRLNCSAVTAQTIRLPANPYDGARISIVSVGQSFATYPVTLDGNGRLIESAATKVINTDGFTRVWLFRADLASWVAVAPFTQADEFPFPPEFDDAFQLRLAMRINPRFGRAMAAESASALSMAMSQLSARYTPKRTVPVDAGLLSLTNYRRFL